MRSSSRLRVCIRGPYPIPPNFRLENFGPDVGAFENLEAGPGFGHAVA